jgi:peptidoglycan/LPS O-acetylase OafA/YrhL
VNSQTHAPSAAHPAYRPDIDGLRAIAVLFVIGFYKFPALFPGGFVGVDVFFLISGYLITGILLRDLRDRRFSFLNFYGRRIRRIFPALLLVLAASLAVGHCNICGRWRSRSSSTSPGLQCCGSRGVCV